MARSVIKLSINFMTKWRLCVFFENFYCITVFIFCKNFWNHQIKPLIVIRKSSKTFFPLHHSPKMITWPYIQKNKVGQNSTVFFQKIFRLWISQIMINFEIFPKKYEEKIRIFQQKCLLLVNLINRLVQHAIIKI
jgi:hypothetical protein